MTSNDKSLISPAWKVWRVTGKKVVVVAIAMKTEMSTKQDRQSDFIIVKFLKPCVASAEKDEGQTDVCGQRQAEKGKVNRDV